MNKQVLILSLFFFLIGNAFSFADENENVMKIHDVEALAGDIILIEVEIINDDTFVAFQLDIPLPESFTVIPDSEQLFRADGHQFSFNVLEGNVIRIFAFDFMATPFLGNDGVIASFEVATDPEVGGEFMLDILNAEIVNPDAVNILTAIIPGTVTLDAMTAFELPFEEDFTGYANGEMPDFWLRTHNNWGVWNSNNAGGESAPELRFNWQPSGEGTFRAITPLLDGSDVDDIMLTFMHSVDDWSGGYTLKIQTSLDGETWTDQWELEIEADKNAPADRKASTRGDIPPTEMMLVLDGVGGEMFHVAFVYEGNSFNINQWYVDDVFVGELVYVADLPFEEDFTGYANGEMPDFWLRTHTNWGVWNSNNAGGQSAPELRFNWSPSGEGTFRAITPLINGIGETEITLSFMHSVNDWSGGYSLLIQTSLDGETWTDQWELEIEADKNAPADRNAATKGDIPSTHVTFDLDGVAGEVFHLAFVYEGNSFNINQWYIDDVFVGDFVEPDTYQVTFVIEDSDGAEIDNAIVTLGNITNDPGDYVFEDILAGEYAYTVIAEGFEPASGMVEVVDEDVTVMVELQPIEDPDGDLIFEQPVFDGGTAVTSVIDDAAEIDYEAADNFWGLSQEIDMLVVYGLTLKFTDGSWQEMVPDPTEPFFVRFYDYVEEFVPGLEAPVSGTYEVALMDSYGDGWNGGLLTVFVNGVAVLTEITMPSGAGPDYHTFAAEAGDEITTLYVPGSWSYENYYAILDPDGNILAEEGGTWDSPGATTPGSIESGMMTVEPDWANPISTQMIDAEVTTIGPVWNGAYTLYRFSLPLEESMDLSEAWVSAQIDANNGSGTWFLWINSDEGDEIAWQRLEAVRSEFVRGEAHPSSLTYKGEASGYRGQLDYDLAFELWTGITVEPDSYMVTFVVQDSDGADIDNATITLGEVTNDPGDYVFEEFMPGEYAYTVIAEGFEPASGIVEVVDEDVTVMIELEAIDDPDGDLIFEQPVFDGGTAVTSVIDDTAEIDYEAADNFWGLSQEIDKLVVYGLTLKFVDGSWQEMVPDPTEPFFVRFYDYVEEFVPGLEAPVSGTYEVALMDSWGDGWNGGLLTVFVNGVAVLTEITMPSGAGPDYHTFTAEAGDEITTLYVAGNWPWENYYAILDPDGNILAEEGGTWEDPGAVVPGSIESGMMALEPDWANPLVTQAIDADVTNIGTVWNGAYTLYRFSLPLEESMDLSEAWVSAQIDANNGSGTWFLWINSDEGDELAWQRTDPVDNNFVRGESYPTSLTYKGEPAGYREQLDYDLAFELWSGTVVEPTDFARVQIIHNSADDLVEEVDIFVNGDLFLENVGFRQATPFMDVPAGVDLDIVVAPAGAGIENGVGPITVQFVADETYVVVAAGNVSAAGYDPVEPFALYVFDQGQEAATNPDNTDLLAFHGSTDAPTVSVWEVTVVNDEIIGDFSFGDFDGYLPLITGDYIIEIRDAAGENVVAAYEAPLASLNLQGEAIVVVASGFLNPADNNDGPAFGLFVALPTGGDLIELPLYEDEPPPVIYNLPFEEDFTDGPIGNVPEDWMRTHSNWAVFNSNNAGGESAPELRFNWTPSGNTTFRAITPLLNGADLDNIMLTFMHSTDDYTGDYTLRIQTSLDGETWTDQWELYVEENLAATDDRTADSKGDIPPTHVTVMLDDVAGEVFHLAFVFEGNSFNINQWYIDDVFVGEAVYMVTLPFEEDFSDAPVGDMPEHWERTHTNWSVFGSNNAGGEAAPELRFNWSPSAIDVFRAITPLLNAADVDDVMLMFMHSVNDYSGDYTLKVQTSLDGETWTDQWTMDMKQAIRTSDDREAEGGRDVPPTEQVVLLDGVGGEQFYLAFVYDGNSWNINQWYIDDIFVGEAMDMFEVTFHVKEDSADEAPIAGASININGDIITTNANGVASISLWAGDYTANITATGYIAESVSFTVANADLDIEVHMLDNIVEPFNLDVTTEGLEPGQALFTWNDYGDEYEFRYDDGVVDAQLGFQGTWNSVMGAVHFNNAVLHEMTWQLTEEGGPHNTVKVWVLGLTPEGLPDRNNVLYTAENVPNTDNQWNTYEFTSPVNAPEGFFIGLSYNGFLGLAVDDGVGAPWDFVPGTQFGVFNITDPTSAFTDISFWGFEVNYLIRAYGANLGEVYTAGSKAFVGFDVFLDGAMVAEGVQDTEFMFEGLTTGEYTAGVRSVYTTGMSDIIGIDFDIEVDQPDLFEVVFHVDISKAMQYDLLGGFDPDVHHILMTGSLLGWAEPGSDPDNQVLEWLTADPMVYGITHHLEAGTYEYKYFSDYIGDGWDGGEWPGDPNRVVVVSGDMLVEDVFGPPDLDVIETDDISVNLYPVPARSRLFVESNVPIAEIRMIDMLGQVVYTTTVNEHRTEIDVSNMRNGIYFIQMTTNRGIITHRVQVTK